MIVQTGPGGSKAGRQFLGFAQRQFAIAIADRALDPLCQTAEPGKPEVTGSAVEIVGGAAQLVEVAVAEIQVQLGQEFLDTGTKITDVLARLFHTKEGNQGIDGANIDVGRTHGLDRLLRSEFMGCQGSAKYLAGQWLVPAEYRVLFQTLYLPEGFFMGKRLTSSRVAAS